MEVIEDIVTIGDKLIEFYNDETIVNYESIKSKLKQKYQTGISYNEIDKLINAINNVSSIIISDKYIKMDGVENLDVFIKKLFEYLICKKINLIKTKQNISTKLELDIKIIRNCFTLLQHTDYVSELLYVYIYNNVCVGFEKYIEDIIVINKNDVIKVCDKKKNKYIPQYTNVALYEYKSKGNGQLNTDDRLTRFTFNRHADGSRIIGFEKIVKKKSENKIHYNCLQSNNIDDKELNETDKIVDKKTDRIDDKELN